MGLTVVRYDDETPSSNDGDRPAVEEQPPSLERPDDDEPPSDDDKPPPLLPWDENEDSLDDEDDEEWRWGLRKARSGCILVNSKIKGIQDRENLSQNKACQQEGIYESLFQSWVKKLKEREADASDGSTVNSQRRKNHDVLTGLLKQHSDILLQYIFELREQGFGVSVRMVVRKVSSISPEFKHKSNIVKDSIVRRWEMAAMTKLAILYGDSCLSALPSQDYGGGRRGRISC